ncbi:MAG: hypothetical protein WC223_12550 [Bacteroidales bacterium]|jgi:hypothetical protein
MALPELSDIAFSEQRNLPVVQGICFGENYSLPVLRSICFGEPHVLPILQGVCFGTCRFNFNLILKEAGTGNLIDGATIEIMPSNPDSNGMTDNNGFVELVILKNTNLTITIKKAGYQTITHKFSTDVNNIYWEFYMNRIIPLCITRKGYAVNLNPSEPKNIVFN